MARITKKQGLAAMQSIIDELVAREYFRANGDGTYSLTERGQGYVEGIASARGANLDELTRTGASLQEFCKALGADK
jgi:predicted transcriptional regulator